MCSRNAGLTLEPTRKRDGSCEFEFCIRGRSDSDYTKDTHTRQSVSGYKIYLEGTPTKCRSVMQKTVELSSCKAEINAAVLCVQDMLYQKNTLESI
jgi:hypothetical protein